jgi:hypothetical protein
VAALAVTVLLAGPPAVAEAAGRGGPEAGASGLWPRLETVWNWVQAVFGADSDKGPYIDPNGSTAESDKGHSIDPDG